MRYFSRSGYRMILVPHQSPFVARGVWWRHYLESTSQTDMQNKWYDRGCRVKPPARPYRSRSCQFICASTLPALCRHRPLVQPRLNEDGSATITRRIRLHLNFFVFSSRPFGNDLINQLMQQAMAKITDAITFSIVTTTSRPAAVHCIFQRHHTLRW